MCFGHLTPKGLRVEGPYPGKARVERADHDPEPLDRRTATPRLPVKDRWDAGIGSASHSLLAFHAGWMATGQGPGLVQKGIRPVSRPRQGIG